MAVYSCYSIVSLSDWNFWSKIEQYEGVCGGSGLSYVREEGRTTSSDSQSWSHFHG